MNISKMIFDTIIDSVTNELKETNYKSVEVIDERDFYINTFNNDTHSLAIRFNKGRGILSLKFQKLGDLIYKTWDFGLSRADSLKEISSFIKKIISSPEETLGKIINSFTGEYHFLANDYPHEITWRNKKYPSVQAAYDKLNKSPVGQVEEKDYLLMISLMKRKFADPVLRQKLIDTDKAVLVNECKDPVWGLVSGYGKNLLGTLLDVFRNKAENSYVKSFKAHTKFEKLSTGNA